MSGEKTIQLKYPTCSNYQNERAVEGKKTESLYGRLLEAHTKQRGEGQSQDEGAAD
jgi:hypothetical protein